MPGDFFREIRAKAALEIHNRKSKGIQASVQQQSRVACPNDKDPMMSLSFKGIEIDVCLKCFGVWLDHGEYEKLIAHLGLPQKPDLLKTSAHLGTLQASNTGQIPDISGIGDIIELVSDICSLIPDV